MPDRKAHDQRANIAVGACLETFAEMTAKDSKGVLTLRDRQLYGVLITAYYAENELHKMDFAGEYAEKERDPEKQVGYRAIYDSARSRFIDAQRAINAAQARDFTLLKGFLASMFNERATNPLGIFSYVSREQIELLLKMPDEGDPVEIPVLPAWMDPKFSQGASQ